MAEPIVTDFPPTFALPTAGKRCSLLSPASGHPCTRRHGHTGRHHFTWMHLGGRLREVWA